MMEVRQVDPQNAILPVLLVDRSISKVKTILGTCFFFSPRPTVLSVAHVLGVEPGPGEVVAVPRRQIPDAEPGVLRYNDVMVPIVNVRKHPQHDLAVADVPDVTHFEHFVLRTVDPPGVPTLMTLDLVSRLTSEPGPSGENVLTITPYIWKGYTHAPLITQDIGMRAPARIIEVSIPIVTGMSGAPLVDEALQVAGILFQNIARSMVPAPRAKNEGQEWYLPIGQAFHWSEAQDFLNSL